MNNLTKFQQTKFVELCLLFQVSYSYSEWLEMCWKILNKIHHTLNILHINNQLDEYYKNH